jgi:hypothetical protein
MQHQLEAVPHDAFAADALQLVEAEKRALDLIEARGLCPSGMASSLASGSRYSSQAR